MFYLLYGHNLLFAPPAYHTSTTASLTGLQLLSRILPLNKTAFSGVISSSGAIALDVGAPATKFKPTISLVVNMHASDLFWP